MSHDLITTRYTYPVRGYWFTPLGCGLIYLNLAPLITRTRPDEVITLNMLDMLDMNSTGTLATTAAVLTLIMAGLAFIVGAWRIPGPPTLLLFVGTATIAAWIALITIALSWENSSIAPGTYWMAATLTLTTLAAIPASRTATRTPRRRTVDIGINDYSHSYDDDPSPRPPDATTTNSAACRAE